jgi:hypothetical protein
VFAEHEASALLSLPVPYDVPVFTTVKVHRDFHVEVGRALYSAPKEYLGCRLDARADSALGCCARARSDFRLAGCVRWRTNARFGRLLRPRHRDDARPHRGAARRRA